MFQEVLTAVMRLRTNRQSVSDARLFRAQVEEAIRLAEKEVKGRGYSTESARLSVFAVVAFVDESVLNQQLEVFADWAREPLQLKLFGVHIAGEIFFDNIQRLLVQADSVELADLLELHQVCLLLGYRGRYGTGSQGELRMVLDAMNDKIRRIRGAAGDLSPAWKVPDKETIPSQADPWSRRLLFAFAGCLALAILLFLAFRLSLGSGAAALQNIGEWVFRLSGR
jgi:type VI secretion system protein ImpK